MTRHVLSGRWQTLKWRNQAWKSIVNSIKFWSGSLIFNHTTKAALNTLSLASLKERTFRDVCIVTALNTNTSIETSHCSFFRYIKHLKKKGPLPSVNPSWAKSRVIVGNKDIKKFRRAQPPLYLYVPNLILKVKLPISKGLHNIMMSLRFFSILVLYWDDEEKVQFIIRTRSFVAKEKY